MLLALSPISVYALTDICKLNEKEPLCAKLPSMIDKCLCQDIHIVLGDFSVVLGCVEAGYEIFVSPHGLGADLSSFLH